MKIISLLAVVVVAATAHAGLFDRGSKSGSTEHLARLFGENNSFTSTAVMEVINKKGKIVESFTMEFASLDGKVRTELNMAGTKAGQKRAQAVDEMAALGMDRMVTIVRPDLKLTYLIYPGLQSYCAIADEAAKDKKDAAPQIERKEIGKETIDGHPCVKYLVTMTEAKGRKVEMTVWQATDLKDFPIQSEIPEGGDLIRTRFTNLKFAKPAASLFEVPKDYTKYESVDALMMGAMQKMMGQGFGQ